MSLDTAKNFAKVTVATGGSDAAVVSITLLTGHGAKLPAVPFNATWWNASDYGDPSDDPNVEIVRVTANSTDVLTVTRAQEGTSASTKNTAGKTYRMVAGLTAKVINTDLGALFAAQVANRIYGGPATGSDAAPTFRALVAADIPNLASVYLTPAAAASAYQPIGSYATLAGAESLSSKTLVTPIIASFTNATHDHSNAAGGGTLGAAAIASGTIGSARLGSGIADSNTWLRGDQVWGSITAAAVVDLGSAAVAFSNKTGNISQWTNNASYTTLAAVAVVGYLTSVTAHALLSATHSDTLAAVVVRGDILYGNSTPAWARLAKPGGLSNLSHDGTDVSWVTATGTGAPVRATSATIVTPTIAKLANLTTNGFVKTGSSDGTLSVDTATYLSSVAPLVLGSNLVEQYVAGANPQTFKLFEFRTDAGNYSRLSISAPTGGPITFTTEASGTGAARSIHIAPAGDIRLSPTAGGAIIAFAEFIPQLGIRGWNGKGVGFAVSGGTTNDTQLQSDSTGILQLNNGTLGTLRDFKLRNVVAQSGYHEMVEMTAPSSPASDTVRVYAVDNGAGKTQLMALFATGAAQQIAIQP